MSNQQLLVLVAVSSVLAGLSFDMRLPNTGAAFAWIAFIGLYVWWDLP